MTKMMRNFNKNREKVQKMFHKFKIFKVDFSFAIIFLIAFFIEEFKFYVVYVLFLIFHELCHFFVAKKLGYYPKRIKLNFFGAVLEGDDDFLISDEIKVVFAGPAFNFCVIVFCYLCFWFEPQSYDFFYDILIANWYLFLFNLLPIFPLDCGRLILLFLSKKMTRQKALKIAKIISFSFIIFMFLLYLITIFYDFNFSLGVAAANLMVLALSNAEDTSYKRQIFVARKFKLLKKGLLERTIYVDRDVPLYSLFKFIDDSHFVKFVFLNSSLINSKEMTEVEYYQEIGLI